MPIYASNFRSNSLSGTVSVVNGFANISLATIPYALEGNKSFVIKIRSGSITGPVLSTSPTITLQDTSSIVSLTANISTVAEGNAILYTLTTANAVDGSNVYFSTNSIVTANVNNNDFVGGNTGIITINNNVGTLTLIANADVSLFDETGERFTLQIRTNNTSGNVVVTSSNVIISDTSNQYNVLSFVENASSIAEGGTITLTTSIINIPTGTLIYYDTTGNVTSSNFTTGNTGSFVMNSVSNTISLVATSVVPYGTSTDFRVRLRRDSATGTVLATSNSLIINDAALSLMSATGGNVTIIPGYKLHTYNTSGTFNVTSIGTTSGNIEYLVIAGGGAGGQIKGPTGWPSGGGGAGGYRTNIPGETSGGPAGSRDANLTLASGTTYTITVGGGASGTTGSVAPQGSPSGILGSGPFANVISTGGGSGSVFPYGGGTPGGSGGGAGGTNGAPDAGTGTPTQGYPGSYFAPFGGTRSGGGGGAAAGAANDPGSANGGQGKQSNVTATLTYRAGGGGGGGKNPSTPVNGGTGGLGGGGNGDAWGGGNPLSPGTVNTGGGGGGGDGYVVTAAPGGSGGSGVVFIRYPWTGQYFTTLTTSTPAIFTGGNATFNLSVLNANGSVLYYSTDGNATSSNFIGGNSGSFVANTTGATITLQSNTNIPAGETRNFTLLIRQDSVTGPVSITGGNVVMKPAVNFTSETLVLGGGGSGGGGYDSGIGGSGGGGGGLVFSNVTLTSGTTYSVTVAPSVTGAAYPVTYAPNGANSTLAGGSVNITAVGGGGGIGNSSTGTTGQNGGSGGGGGYNTAAGGAGYGYPSPTQQGYPGGVGGASTSKAGGGGGTGQAGNSGSQGNGGDGASIGITGSNVNYGGGGGGGNAYPGANPGGTGGLGGGGNGGYRTPGGTWVGGAGTDNLGGGGGGGGRGPGSFTQYNGGAGGSGVIIFAYPNTQPNISIVSGSLTVLTNTTSRPGYLVHSITSGSGTITFI